MSHDIDTRLRTAWHGAGEATTPQVQGRLRAARRAALDGPGARRASPLRWVGLPAGAFAAVAMVALLAPRLQAPPAAPNVPQATARVPSTPSVPATSANAGDDVLAALAVEDDPEFYLWLDGIAPPPLSEVRHDPS